MKSSLGVSNFLEEISSLSHSIVFLYFFALITWESFLMSPRYSLQLCIQMHLSSTLSFAFHVSSSLSHFEGILRQASSDRHPQTAICLFAFILLGLTVYTMAFMSNSGSCSKDASGQSKFTHTYLLATFRTHSV